MSVVSSPSASGVRGRAPPENAFWCIGVGAHSTLGWGHDIFYRKIHMKTHINNAYLESHLQKDEHNKHVLSLFYSHPFCPLFRHSNYIQSVNKAMMDAVFRQHMEVRANNQDTCGKSPAMSEEKYNAVVQHLVQHLLHPKEKVDSHFKFWIKGRRFQLVISSSCIYFYNSTASTVE